MSQGRPHDHITKVGHNAPMCPTPVSSHYLASPPSRRSSHYTPSRDATLLGLLQNQTIPAREKIRNHNRLAKAYFMNRWQIRIWGKDDRPLCSKDCILLVFLSLKNDWISVLDSGVLYKLVFLFFFYRVVIFRICKQMNPRRGLVLGRQAPRHHYSFRGHCQLITVPLNPPLLPSSPP